MFSHRIKRFILNLTAVFLFTLQFVFHFVKTAGQFGRNEFHSLIGDSLEVISRISLCNRVTTSAVSEVLQVLFLRVLNTLMVVLGSVEASVK